MRDRHRTALTAVALAAAALIVALVTGCDPADPAPTAAESAAPMYPPSPGAATCATWSTVTDRATRIRALPTGHDLPPAGVAAVAAALNGFCREHPAEDLGDAAGFLASCWAGDHMPPEDRRVIDDTLDGAHGFTRPYPCP